MPENIPKTEGNKRDIILISIKAKNVHLKEANQYQTHFYVCKLTKYNDV